MFVYVFFFQAEDGIRDLTVTGVQTCALPISNGTHLPADARRGEAHFVGAVVVEPESPDDGLDAVAVTAGIREALRSGEGCVGEEGRYRWGADHLKKKKKSIHK